MFAPRLLEGSPGPPGPARLHQIFNFLVPGVFVKYFLRVSVNINPTHTKVPPTSVSTGFSVEGRISPIPVGPVRRAVLADMGKSRP